jgi:hypothetical protein
MKTVSAISPVKSDPRLLQLWGNHVCTDLAVFRQPWPGMNILVPLEKQGGPRGHLVVQTGWFRTEPAFRVFDSSFGPIPPRRNLYLRFEWLNAPEKKYFRDDAVNRYVAEVLTALRWAIENYQSPVQTPDRSQSELSPAEVRSPDPLPAGASAALTATVAKAAPRGAASAHPKPKPKSKPQKKGGSDTHGGLGEVRDLLEQVPTPDERARPH